MGKRPPSTPALRALRDARVEHELHAYRYVPKGGTAASSAALGVDEHQVVKTLVFETHEREPVIVLMHGDLMVSAKALARLLGVKSTRPCEPSVAERHTGYRVGGTSPFGLRKAMRVVAQASIRELERLWINAGQRGWLASMTPSELERVLDPEWAEVATTRGSS